MSSLALYSIIIFLTAFVGGAIPLLLPNLSDNRLKLFVCAGAGLLLGMGLLHMLPEAAKLAPNTFAFWFLAGFLILMLQELVFHPAHEKSDTHYHTAGLATYVGMSVHGLIEGFALASTLMVGEMGPLVLIAILSHKAPQGFALTTILKLGKKTNAQILAFVTGVSLSGPAGAFVAYALLKTDRLPSSAGILLAMSAGTFLYIAACDLMPELHRDSQQRRKRLIAFLIGIGLAFISGFLTEGHGH